MVMEGRTGRTTRRSAMKCRMKTSRLDSADVNAGDCPRPPVLACNQEG
jgi:hypothetical protein